MTSKTFVRFAVPEDGPAIACMGRAFHAEAGIDHPFDGESFAHSCALLGTDGAILVIDAGGVAVGMAAVVIHQSFWNRNVTLARQCMWWIDPPHRKGTGRMLLAALEELVAARGAVLLDAVAEDGTRSQALSRIYRAGGFSPAESIFRKCLNGHEGRPV